jgi:hypothetical protein
MAQFDSHRNQFIGPQQGLKEASQCRGAGRRRCAFPGIAQITGRRSGGRYPRFPRELPVQSATKLHQSQSAVAAEVLRSLGRG